MRERGVIVWIGLLALLLVLLNLPLPLARQAKAAVREGLAPLHEALAGLALRVREAAGTVRGLGGLARQNRELQAETFRLRNELRALQAQGLENVELRELLGFRARTAYPLVACEVIARDASGWWQAVRLNRGLRDGVGIDRAVVTPDGLAGRTFDATANTCDVLLLSDPNCRVSAHLPRSGSFGVVAGQGVGHDGAVRFRMDFINRNHEVRPGDEVVTSGLGGVFPADLSIGYVEAVETDESGLYRRAIILPKADIGRLRHAFVLTDGASGEKPQGTDSKSQGADSNPPSALRGPESPLSHRQSAIDNRQSAILHPPSPIRHLLGGPP